MKIDGYLTEAKLCDALKCLCGAQWSGEQVKLPEGRCRWDMSINLASNTVVVEYDGDEHYCNTLKIKRDREKDNVARKHGLHLVRVPYWVQLTSETLKYYFGIDGEIEQTFQHGFITTKWFPASFCELGVQRFSRELEALPPTVRSVVIRSLKERSAEHGVEYVLPGPLLHLIQ